jgi:hybrid polyketide synthase/nonribosomal peptide synthetase ACE1
MIGFVSPPKWSGTLLHRIDEITKTYSHAPALKDGLGNLLTYSNMFARINTIAVSLLNLGVGEGSIVGVFQEPSTDWICSILAILRLGAIYVPLDPRMTTMRLAAIVKDCKPGFILVDDVNEKDLPLIKSQSKMVNVSQLAPNSSTKTIPNASKADSPMTILYTSGSTGKPKGIVMGHANIRDHVETVTKAWISKMDQVIGLQQSSLGFDMSLVQIFWPLCSGGSVYVAPQSVRGDPVEISKIISFENISLTTATPSEYIGWIKFGDSNALQKSPWTLGISGGEKITQSMTQVFRDLNKSDFRLINCYGPTETTFFSHFSELSFEKAYEWDHTSSTLAPWTNVSTYVVDSNLQPVPIGVPGEIAIGGMGVASGYLNMKEMTSRHFLPDAFASEKFRAQGWDTMHLTGDSGRLRPDGTLLLEGRIVGDTQIKLRGLRIDLQDVEAAIIQSAHGRVLNTIVSVRQTKPSDPEFLVAHIEISPDDSPQDSDVFVRKLLADLPLPQYMRPALIIPVLRLPRTDSGKIHRSEVAVLPLQKEQDPSTNVPRTFNQTEIELLRLWEEVLTKEVMGHFTVDSQSDFFQVGGSSLLLVSLRSLIKKTFLIDLPLVQLFDVSTLGRMAAKIQTQQYPNDIVGSSIAAETLTNAEEAVFNPPATSTPDSINWEAEVSIPSSLPASTVLGVNEPRVVILTGATGFLGKALLRRLVSTHSIEKVYCIAVRPNSSRSDPVFSSSKVLIYTGDQSAPLLGLTPSESNSILSEADTIIHNGADVSFLKVYSSLRKPNVESTKQLANWAVNFGLQFHYISTASVTYLSGQESYPSVSMRNFPPPSDGSNGYIASKWASEIYLEKINQEFGLPLIVHRPSSITGLGASETDVMSSLLKYSKILRAIPKSEYIHGYFDFISVEKAATEIVELVQSGIEEMDTRYVFMSGEVQIRSEDMKTAMEMQTGDSVVELEMKDWVERAQVVGMNGMVGAFLDGSAGQALLMTKLVKDEEHGWTKI